ncbi:hypothetical protein AB0C10_36010 [Microbispora amethystogenes]|uniref:Uncharacterized protein n=1 Tax=Microbispora amethystogenes TaxID=1427754 RepID=A0ABQ4FIK1_9ACTN|nr:hypothetical protein [Microbispora amethystogenes]GIH34633.1 hypothetical protein Mam01_47970 [Microbispora amethystogenes]
MTTTEATPGPTAGGTTTTRARTSRARTTTPTPPVPAPPTPGPSMGPGTKEEHRPRLDLDLPFMSLQLRAPEMHLPHVGLPHISGREVGHAMDVARTFLPPPERIMYYGGLGALAVLGILEWPVAAAIGAGTMIAQRARSREQRWSPLGGPQQKGARGAAAPGMPTPGATTPGMPGAGAMETAPEAARQAAGRRTAAKGEPKTPATAATRRGRAAAK